LRPALSRYFAYRAEVTERDLNELFRVGLTSLMIGAAVLALCILAARAVTSLRGDDDIRRFIEESLIILGWVANWRPIEIFSMTGGRWHGAETSIRRLAAAEVELTSAPRPT
jgi:hypothetical protein